MDTLFWIIVAVVVVGIVWYLITKKKEGTGTPQRPQEPTSPETPVM